MKGLTSQQASILQFIEEYISINRYSPSYREIADKFGFKSMGSVFKHIQALKKKEAISSNYASSRSVRMTQTTQKAEKTASGHELLLIGELSSTNSLETFPHSQTVEVPSLLVDSPENTYVIRIKGDGFQDELLLNGDLIIVEARNEATEGETIVAMVNKHEPLIKIYEKESGYIKLYGHNHDQHPLIMHPDDLSIYGVVVGMIRVFHR
jgi:repressor LexA